MKGVKLNMDHANCVLLVVILVLVIYCVVKQNEGFVPNIGALRKKALRGSGKRNLLAGLSANKAKRGHTRTNGGSPGALDALGP